VLAWEVSIHDPGLDDGGISQPYYWMEHTTLHLFKDARGLLGV
jgi:hypothetical protein